MPRSRLQLIRPNVAAAIGPTLLNYEGRAIVGPLNMTVSRRQRADNFERG